MSLITEYRATEDAIKELQKRLADMQGDENLQKDMDFEKKLRELMGKYSKSLKDINGILDPQSLNRLPVKGAAKAQASSGTRAVRKVKQYKNPHSGEIIETKGGNHKGLKEWKTQYGAEEVEGWMTLLD